jgi:hypothetical protein
MGRGSLWLPKGGAGVEQTHEATTQPFLNRNGQPIGISRGQFAGGKNIQPRKAAKIFGENREQIRPRVNLQ